MRLGVRPMSHRALYSSDVSHEHIADALEALATDLRNGDAHLTRYTTDTDVTVEEAVEWHVSVDFVLAEASEYKRVTDPHELGDNV